MSYEVVRKIEFTDDKKVYITCYSNNVMPHIFDRSEFPGLSKVLQEQGKREVDIRILLAFEEGTFQGGNTKYKHFARKLKEMPEYKPLDWQNPDRPINFGEHGEQVRELIEKVYPLFELL